MRELLPFYLGYLLALATPGPNMMAIASVTAIFGRGAAIRLIGGLSLGAAALAASTMALTATAGAVTALAAAGPVVSGSVLVCIGLRVFTTRYDPQPGSRRSDAPGFFAGICSALTNPITAAYFFSQSVVLGATGHRGMAAAMIFGVLALCAFNGGLVVLLLGISPVRDAIANKATACRAICGSLLCGLGVWVMEPTLAAWLPGSLAGTGGDPAHPLPRTLASIAVAAMLLKLYGERAASAEPRRNTAAPYDHVHCGAPFVHHPERA